MDFLSKLITRPKSLILPSADSMDNVQQSAPINGTPNNEAQQRTTTKKPSSSDLSGGDQSKDDILVIGDKNIVVTDQVLQQESKKILDKNKEQVKNCQLNSSSSTTILPDIVNVQPAVVEQEGDDSLISSLTNNLNFLRIDTKNNSTLTIPTSTCDAVSSDEEIFAECQTYTDQPVTLETDINRSIHWDTVLSTVTSSNLENIDNTTDQIVTNLDLDLNQEFIPDSASHNGDISTSPLHPPNVSKVECIEVGIVSSADSTLVNKVEENKQNDVEDLNKSVNLKAICKDALSIYSDDEERGLDVTSSVGSSNLPGSNSNSPSKDTSKLSLNESKELNRTIEVHSSEPLTNDSIQNQTISNDITLTSNSNSEIVKRTDTSDESVNQEPTPSNSAKEVNIVEKSATVLNQSKQKDEFPEQNVTLLNETCEIAKTLSNQNSNLNETINISADISLEGGSEHLNSTNKRLSCGKVAKQLRKSIPSSPQNSKKITNKTKCSEVAVNDGDLNSTFAPSTEALNSTIDMPTVNRTFDANDLNGTFDAKESELALNQTVEMTSPVIKKNVNENISTNDDMSKTIVIKKIQPTETVEPMDVDMPSPAHVESISAKSNYSEKPPALNQGVFIENLMNPMDVTFKAPTISAPGGKRKSLEQPNDSDFQGHGIILNPSDFDYLLTKGNNSVQIDNRNSLLLRFDPLLGHSVPANQSSINNLNLTGTLDTSPRLGRLSPAVEEDEEPHSSGSGNLSPQSSTGKEQCDVTHVVQSETKSPPPCKQNSGLNTTIKTEKVSPFQSEQQILTRRIQNSSGNIKNDDKMSVDVIQGIKIENDSKSEENISPKSEEKQEYKMDDLEKKIKNEVLKTEDIEKKLKDAEQREEALLKRITEKDKTIAKMSGVIEAYEKAIAELIAEKEQLIQNYEKQMTELKSERDLNYKHLTSLESTFSDLHVKYERSKQLTSKLKASEEELKARTEQNLENLRLQEQRYEKMKNHAMQQLEIANNKLESLTKNHAMEVTRLKALLKKEEISRLSINEQLQQKSRENEELMKICDELINGQGASS